MSHLYTGNHFRTPSARAGLALGLAFSAAACGDPTGSRAHAVSLSFSTVAPSAVAASYAVPLRADVSASSGGNTLVVTKAQLVLSRIELAGSAATCGGTDDSGCDEMELAPMLVDLPLAGGVASSISAPVPAGSYAELEAKIDAVRDGEEGAAAFLAAHPDLRGVSVRVEGTYNGQPFVYTGSGEASLELAFSPPVSVGASGMNLTVHVDVAGWFKDGSGNVIDPATANAGGANASVVENNIHHSFHAFEDNDRDGRDD